MLNLCLDESNKLTTFPGFLVGNNDPYFKSKNLSFVPFYFSFSYHLQNARTISTYLTPEKVKNST